MPTGRAPGDEVHKSLIICFEQIAIWGGVKLCIRCGKGFDH